MMSKIFNSFIFFIFLINISEAQWFQRSKSDIGFPFFYFVTPAYFSENTDQVKLEVYVKISHDAIQFLKYGSGFKAEYELTVSIFDSEDSQILEDIFIGTIITDKYSETTSKKLHIMETRTFYLDPGKYKINVKLMDFDTRKTGRKTHNIDLNRFKKDVVISDLLMINPHKRDGEGFPDGYPILPPILTNRDSIVYLYSELKVSEGHYTLKTKVTSSKQKVISEEIVEEESNGEIIQHIIEYKPLDIGSKSFKVEIELEQDGNISKTDILVKVRWRGLTSQISNLDEAVNQLRYIAPSNDIRAMKKVASSKKKERLFKEFWKKRDPTPKTTENELMDEYYRRVNFANERYGSFRKGWETARGMIFILFGPPDDIETNLFSPDGKAYLKWSYYVINRTFIFVDRNGFGDYELTKPYYPTIGSGIY